MLCFKSGKIKIPLIFIAVLFLAVSINAQIPVKTIEETEIPVLKKIGLGYLQCRVPENVVIAGEQKFKEIITDDDCPSSKILEVDFTKQTLIGFIVRGDCFVRAAAKVFRRDNEKKYTVRIKNIWGGCRAAGSFQGWLVIEKIPSDYTVEFTGTRVDGNDGISEDEEFSYITLPTPQKNEILETRQVELKGCIQTIFNKKFIIKDRETFLKTIRNDASRDFCLKNLEKIDFDKNTLLGIELNTGYCRTPPGLESQAVKDEAEKQYILNISYTGPQGLCRALSQYDLWILVPKLPENYTVKFNVKATARDEKTQ